MNDQDFLLYSLHIACKFRIVAMLSVHKLTSIVYYPTNPHDKSDY